MITRNMIVKNKFAYLENEIKKIINELTENSEIHIVKPENGEGLYVVFGKLEIRSSIRLYPTTSDDHYSYAIGNKQFKLTYEEVLKRFQREFKSALYNFNKNMHTSPIDELIKFKEERFKAFKQQEGEKKEQKLKSKEKDNHLISLENSDFVKAIKKITQSTFEQKQYSATLQQKVNEKKLYNEINSFINKVESTYKSKILLNAKEGRNKNTFSFTDIQNPYFLNNYSEKEIEEVLKDELIVNRLEKIFNGFFYQTNIIKQSYRPFNLLLHIEW